MHNPEVLFLDEPTTGIDVENARHIRKLLLDLNKNGTTIFLTTHYIEEAERLCHRIAFIVNGKIVKTDYTDELLKAAQEENTVQITAAEDISELPGLLRQVFPGYRFEIIDQRAIRIYSAEAIDLIPIIEVFKNNNLSVYEAKIVRPSLEDVFVKVTGIEAQEMKNEGGHK